ncbi:peptide ABC transporter substrate-binding protein [Staphylococcus arlettae]|uniref:peptide ABC transporter substrate-binding protein n=1 Tax=Staphylococcus arlettae TaxID=29378 RepID=UPI000D1A8781|nr:peptide ABC transporter substrate-binding protein [Staphylococcus arlettae]MBF0737271.1 peptide ABC transporter substrate-binding protein [Staphylococcus arlettae]MCD8864558.1 peptide ABC transporter substrate-binding protein [Staphylococcus arlettae]MCE4985334.1 peptide ABC transporter substrate-binding protein [Staphylococcus arlettae]PTH30756.1 peptide ABC transporter substrate-binding protein [Staphylococcus arlettae]PTH54858.1 peptide ABC transporter substrate-binding protein [Staphylo
MKKFKLLIITIALAVVLAGCSSAEGIYSDKGQVFRKVIPQDMASLDTAMVTDTVSFDIFNQVYEGLYSLNDKDEAIPGVAKELPKESNGGKTLTIKLRKDAKWSNGDKVTAHDFVYSWQRALKPDTAAEYAYIMYDIKNAEEVNLGKKDVDELGVKAVDDYTLKVELTKPIPYINELFAFGIFMPQNEKAVKKYGEQYGTTAEKSVYNGPFKVKNWKVEDKIELEKNKDYWDSKKVHLDRVNYKVLKDQQAGAALYDTSSVDDAIITADQVEKYEGNEGLQKRLLASTFFIKMNQKEVPEFKNKDMRLAIAKSINKEAFVNSVKNDGSEAMDGFTSKLTAKTPNGKDFADVIDSPLAFNAQEAQKHYDKAKKELGIKNFTFTMITDDGADKKIAAEFIKAQVEKNLPGATMKIQQVPFKQRVNRELSENYETSLSGWGPDYPDPLTFLSIMTTGNSQNNTGWSSKEYDQLVKDANGKLLKKPEERNAAMIEAENLLLKDAPVAPIYQKGEAHLTNPQVKGLVYHQIGGDTSLKNVKIDKSIDRETGEKK